MKNQLRAAASSSDTAVPRTEASTDQGCKTRVMVVSSDDAVRESVRDSLSSHEFDVVEADGEQQALDSVMRGPAPQAMLIDAQSEGLDGLRVCRQWKADSKCLSIPVIVITNAGDSEGISDAVTAGADELLGKPINRSELNLRLRSVTRSRQPDSEMVAAESVALSLARAVASKDGYSSGHVEQVANCAIAFGKTLGLDPSQLKMLRYGAVLHNVGKIAIPDSILEKTGPLTPRERALFHQHPRVGSDICSPLEPLRPVLPIIRHHKEHFDGTGYPDGLRGEQIPLLAQIVGVVDIYCALTNDRPFRRAKSNAEAIEILRERASQGVHDKNLVERFCAVFAGQNNDAVSQLESVISPVSAPGAANDSVAATWCP